MTVTDEYLAHNAAHASTSEGPSRPSPSPPSKHVAVVAAEAVPDLAHDVRQSLRRMRASPFVTKHRSLRGFVFHVATGKLNGVAP